MGRKNETQATEQKQQCASHDRLDGSQARNAPCYHEKSSVRSSAGVRSAGDSLAEVGDPPLGTVEYNHAKRQWPFA